MKNSIAIVLCAGMTMLLSLTGCIHSTRVQSEKTVGQQLEDLDKSYKDGIITQKEYERLKKAIISKND